MNPWTSDRTPWTESAHCKASTYMGQHNTEKHRHTSMPQVGFKPVIPVFKL